ncbi:betaine aldehyde dehydrogenase [Reticulomyxa filosa]|uniref:Betaine aldehyde dehydrogenase n=1 Tax=Reticulomyxa filosa TaxID=46433 RepID=X6NRR2_RETFI|nr:betaine aldehyde dehydrogenase [Reticulomyxa filosa]|eukprot:ETO28633.1 betaine aldehyde dehydrogenase [Reticulomyxa filosa]
MNGTMKLLSLFKHSRKYISIKLQAPRTVLRGKYGLWINGTTVDPGRAYIDVTYPHDHTQIVSQVVNASVEHVDDAVNAAWTSFHKEKTWRNMDVRDRSTILMNCGKLLRERISDFAKMEVLQTGRPIREMNAQLQRLPEWFEYYGSLIRTAEDRVLPFKGANFLNYVTREPLGVCVLLTAWNHPLLLSIKKISVALATGNSVICKPSELAPCSIYELAHLMQKADFFFFFYHLWQYLNFFFFKKKKSAYERAAADQQQNQQNRFDRRPGDIQENQTHQQQKYNLLRYTAELGGKSPMIVFDDIALDKAINGCAFGAFIASGQTCIMGSRILVQDKCYDEFVKKFVEKVQEMTKRMGDPMNPDTQLGPLISMSHRDKVHEKVKAALADNPKCTLLCGGNLLDKTLGKRNKGSYYEPTVIANVTSDMTIFKEEIFGPVVVITRFTDEEHAIALANDGAYGLAASVWTENLGRAHRVSRALDCGIVWVNDHHKNDPCSPFGGFKNSGIGRENGIDAFLEYTQSKSTIINFGTQSSDWFASNPSANVRYS